jgi:hypothetical protein
MSVETTIYTHAHTHAHTHTRTHLCMLRERHTRETLHNLCSVHTAKRTNNNNNNNSRCCDWESVAAAAVVVAVVCLSVHPSVCLNICRIGTWLPRISKQDTKQDTARRKVRIIIIITRKRIELWWQCVQLCY